MPLPIPNLDDRSFDDLAAEARQRILTHVPELTQIAPGDALFALTDLFAWLSESILYRGNLITERQRRVFLNLLKVPLRPAIPATGLVSLDLDPTAAASEPLARGIRLTSATSSYTTASDLQATPLSLKIVTKQRVDPALIDLDETELIDQYELNADEQVDMFQPREFAAGSERLTFADTLDRAYYLAFTLPEAGQVDSWRDRLRDQIINIGLGPDPLLTAGTDSGAFDSRRAARRLRFDLLHTRDTADQPHVQVQRVPLEIVSNSTQDATRLGVIRLRLPANADLFDGLVPADPMFHGFGARPPEVPSLEDPQRIAFWLRLSVEDEDDLLLGQIDVNSVEVLGTRQFGPQVIAVGDGQADQAIDLGADSIDADSMVLDVHSEGQGWQRWTRVDVLAGHNSETVYHLDAHAGRILCGDGITTGARWRLGERLRVAYQAISGEAGNVAAGEVRSSEDVPPGVRVRQAAALTGGAPRETLAQAEARIPRFLTHRNRAVTADDFRHLTLGNPVNPVARCEVVQGFIPGTGVEAVRRAVPGAVSVFVLPPQAYRGEVPRPTRVLLTDIYQYLADRILVGTELYVLSPEYVRLAVGVGVELVSADAEGTVFRDIRRALFDHLSPLPPGGLQGAGWSMGRTVEDQELLTQVARVSGVRKVSELVLFQETASGWQPVSEIALQDYQLPELAHANVDTGDAPPPEAVSPVPVQGVPTPVIPDLC